MKVCSTRIISKRKKFIGFGLSAIEWYDFAVYSSISVTLGQLFFNVADPFTNLLYSLTTFALGYIIRPLGSSLFGYLAIRKHTDTSMAYTLLTMSIATIGIGSIPIHENLYILPIVLLCIFRIMQGLAMGGCYGASYLYVSQHAKPGHKNRATAFVCMGFLLGFILGSSVASACYFIFRQEGMLNNAWRIPFLIGGLSSFILYIFCKKTAQLSEEEIACANVSLQAHTQNFFKLLKCILVIGLDMIGFYLFFVFNPQFLIAEQIGTAANITLQTTLMLLLLVPTIWLCSFITDKWKVSNMLTISTILFGCAALIFPWVDFSDNLLILLMLGTCYASLPNWVIGQFKGIYRGYYTGLAFNIASAIFAGTTPVASIILIRYDVWYLRFAILIISFIILLCIQYGEFMRHYSKEKQ